MNPFCCEDKNVLNIQNFNPFVRFARIKELTIPQGISQAIDHRIFYCHSGNGQLEAEGKLYPFMAGTLIYLPAGTPYRYLFNQEIPMFSGCNFDFFQDHNSLNTPIPPLPHSCFHQQDILEKQILENDNIFAHCLYLEHAFQFEEKFTEIAKEFVNHNLYYDVRCSTLLKDVLIMVARLNATNCQGSSYKNADDILQYIHSHYDKPLTNKDIAAHFNYHENYISTLIFHHTGLTLHQYVLKYKIHMAIVLLESTTISISEIAEKVGIPNINHFSKCFKKIVGHSPSQFRVK